MEKSVEKHDPVERAKKYRKIRVIIAPKYYLAKNPRN